MLVQTVLEYRYNPYMYIHHISTIKSSMSGQICGSKVFKFEPQFAKSFVPHNFPPLIHVGAVSNSLLTID